MLYTRTFNIQPNDLFEKKNCFHLKNELTGDGVQKYKFRILNRERKIINV